MISIQLKKLDNYINEKISEKLNGAKGNKLTDKFKIEIANKDSEVIRNYKLNVSTKFQIFEDYFLSELKTKKLDCVLNREQSKLIEKEKLSTDQHKVRNILINRIETSYYNRILKMTNPYEIFNKLREYKLMEARTNFVSAKR